MRVSAYVPDHVWSKAMALHPGSGPSNVVQRALRHLVERSRPRFASQLDGQRQQVLGLRQSRVVQMAQHAYDEGYGRGLVVCETLSWAALERMAAAHWSTATMAANGARTEPRLVTTAYQSGLRDALRDVWLAALESGRGQPD